MRCVNAQCAVSVHVTATETPRGQRMCANSGRIYGGNVQEMHSEKKETVMISCSEMRTVAPSVRHVEAAIHRCRAGQERCHLT